MFYDPDEHAVAEELKLRQLEENIEWHSDEDFEKAEREAEEAYWEALEQELADAEEASYWRKELGEVA